jgi:hypothetical protein
MKVMISRNPFVSLLGLLALLVTVAVGMPALAASAAKAQKSFASPEAALQNLVSALKKDNQQELLAILGPGSESIVSSGDPVSDKAGKERFLKLYEEKKVIEKPTTGKAVISVGNDRYPFPIPLVKKGGKWVFDTKAGKDELLSRRIGSNELSVIEVLQAYVEAQHEYASSPAGALEFAQKVRSTPGQKDGLYWEAKEGEPESPFGPMIAKATAEGYGNAQEGEPAPYHGYLFRILKGQGKNAPGGAYDYVFNGRMVLGFGAIAYPAEYGASGIMTFIVNQNGAVYQKDLGKDTAKTAAAIKLYDPDKTWKKVK